MFQGEGAEVLMFIIRSLEFLGGVKFLQPFMFIRELKIAGNHIVRPCHALAWPMCELGVYPKAEPRWMRSFRGRK